MRKKALVFLTILSALAFDMTAQRSDESAIRTLEQKWDAANLKGDAAALDAILAETFIMTGDDGKVRTKAEVIGELRNGNIKYQAANTEEVKVILHADAAVVSGKWRGRYTFQGKSVDLLERFTNFYIRRGGQWQCIASHGSAIK